MRHSQPAWFPQGGQMMLIGRSAKYVVFLIPAFLSLQSDPSCRVPRAKKLPAGDSRGLYTLHFLLTLTFCCRCHDWNGNGRRENPIREITRSMPSERINIAFLKASCSWLRCSTIHVFVLVCNLVHAKKFTLKCGIPYAQGDSSSTVP